MSEVSYGMIVLPDGSEQELMGPEGLTDEQVGEYAKAGVSAWQASHQQAPTKQVQQTPQRQEDEERGILDFAKQQVKNFVGAHAQIADIGTTMVTGAVGRVAGGVAGLAGILLPGEENQGTRWQENTESALTKDLWLDESKRTLAAAANAKFIPRSSKGIYKQNYEKGKPIIDHYDSLVDVFGSANQALDDASLSMAGGNPELGTAIQTIVKAAPDLVMGKLPYKKAMSTALEIGARKKAIRAHYNDVKNAAQGQGYKLTNDELPDSVVRVAENMAPEKHAAANVDDVAASVKKAKQQMSEDIDKMYEQARASEAFATVKPIQERMVEVQKKLVEDGFDVAEMPRLNKRLSEFKNLDTDASGIPNTTGLTVKQYKLRNLRDLDLLERRITNDLRGKKRGDFSAEDVALLRVRTALRNQLKNEFDSGAIRGDAKSIEFWRDARALRAKYEKQFNSERWLRDMVKKDASPEQVYQWIVGSSAQGAKKSSAAAIRRLKDILGDNHPSLVLIRNAAIRDVAMPLFDSRAPNFNLTVKNIDRLLENNPSLVKELNIPVKELQTLKRAAAAADDLNVRQSFINQSIITRTLASILFGHQIARKGRIVQFSHKVMDALLGTGKISNEQLVRHMADLDYNQPLVIPKGRMWTEIMVRGAAADAMQDSEDYESDPIGSAMQSQSSE